jgi:hypothetical protein
MANVSSRRKPIERVGQDIDRWVRELEFAGWKRWRDRMTIWESPEGHLYRGPFHAWQVMRSMRKRNA